MIYFFQPTDGGPIKIGYSADVERRRDQLESHYKPDRSAIKIGTAIRRMFKRK